MSEQQISDWVTKQMLPKPDAVGLLKAGHDVRSIFLHWNKVTLGQLQTFCDHLTGHYLTHKPTSVVVSLDTRPRKRRAATWLKKGYNMYHTGSCRGRGRKASFLTYHGYLKDASGELVRKECDCCSMPWPACRICMDSLLINGTLKQQV